MAARNDSGFEAGSRLEGHQRLSDTADAQQPDEFPTVWEGLGRKRCLDQGILLPRGYRGAGELAELFDDVGRWRERVLAAARSFARFAMDQAIAKMHIDAHHVAESCTARGDR